MMLKPTSLQNHLIAANPDLRQNPDKLLVFADEGNVVATGSGSLSFEYRYKLNIILTDYSGDPDAIIVPLLAWIALHQSDLLNNPTLRQTGIGFDVDFNNHETIDLSLKLDLTERVIVKREGGRLAIRHPPEAQPTPDYSDDFWALYQGESLLAEWHTPVQLA
ncbi:phage tail protein [Glaciimonas sp. CA11.2]|uniref:phage tail protein n=1 Tax=Glaciimonas sp. CA11.2 TaxID=3048601 RepID=UPI002AB3C608|nr:phage tail protein [Glaciimonas sp. CA11.2]MDY7547274.1 phage tail protein [Glaciimonas sp. CA11.2]